MDHGLTRRIFDFGDGALTAGLGVVLLTDFHVLIDIDEDDMLRRDFAQRRQYRLNKKLAGPGDARAHVAVVVRQALMEHDAVAESDFLFKFFKILLAGFHLPPPSLPV